MELGTLLKPEAVKVVTAASSKKRLLHEIADLVQQAYHLDAGVVIDALTATVQLHHREI